jgi:2-keto-4-pentenoate hydratase/2-oxohepta-3-ene-1,7-dioic acid hydratase in catechol pathway
MKLVSFDDYRIGVIVDETVVDITAIAGGNEQWPPMAMTRLIADFDRLRPAVEQTVAKPGRPVSAVTLKTPVPWPSKIIAYPANYHEHAEEMGREYRANTQGFFLKPPSSLSGPSDPIVLPLNSDRRIDHECELGIIIGKGGRDIARDDWASHVFGYTCLIDAVIRGKEERVARKAFDSFCPVGPWIVTADEVGDPGALRGTLWVNGEIRQDANTRDMVLDVPGMIEMASSIMTLYPGDIIAAGTPAGVGPIRDGDTVRIRFDKIGEMTLNVIQGNTGRLSLFARVQD